MSYLLSFATDLQDSICQKRMVKICTTLSIYDSSLVRILIQVIMIMVISLRRIEFEILRINGHISPILPTLGALLDYGV